MRTFLREKLDERSFQRWYVDIQSAVFQLNFKGNEAEMRKPLELLIRLEDREFLRIAVLQPSPWNMLVPLTERALS